MGLADQLDRVRFAGELPAFIRQNGEFVMTPEMERVTATMQPYTDVPLEIEPAPSVITGITGQPMWGSGGGLYNSQTGRAFVDPIRGSVTTGAHELAHQGFRHPLMERGLNPDQINTVAEPDFEGNPRIKPEFQGSAEGLHQTYEAFGAPVMIEEANAQGVATEAMQRALGRRPSRNGWGTMYDYPEEYKFNGVFDRTSGIYESANPRYGPAYATDEERAEAYRMRDVAGPRVRRAFEEGRRRLR